MNEIHNQSSGSPQIDTLKPEVSFEEFTKLDLRVGLILEATRVPKSNKLIELRVDLGIESRTILAGIGKVYEPEFLIHKQIVVIANLAPRMLMGKESRGMVMAASGQDSLPLLLEAPIGAKPGQVIR
ncbi:MAG: methionine--tRNA ligase subunit beta [Holophagaceae bacterium]|jgi:methionyl-tRNA synthetase